MGQERLHLRAEGEQAGPVVVEEWLLPRSVPGEQEAPPRAVPEREGEHAVQERDCALPSLLVEVKDDLGVTLAAEAVAGFELLP
jgi:hypothetical protein